MPERLFPSEMYSLEIRSAVFRAPEFARFPVKFPVSREFGQRKVSARLPAPPASLNRRETAPPFAAKYAKMPVFCNISSAKWTGENGLPGIKWRQSAGLSLDGKCAVG